MLSQGSSFETFRDLSNYSILLIDDDPDQRLVIEALLGTQGYRVTSAESAREGMSKLSRRYFDLVICDLRMPDMNGFDFIQEARAIRRIPQSSWLPIILLTSCSSDMEFAALGLGADMFCEKKYASKLLLSQVEFLLS